MRETGYSLIEIVVVLGIAAVLLGLGVGSFQTALVSTRVRSAAESIQAGLRAGADSHFRIGQIEAAVKWFHDEVAQRVAPLL